MCQTMDTWLRLTVMNHCSIGWLLVARSWVEAAVGTIRLQWRLRNRRVTIADNFHFSPTPVAGKHGKTWVFPLSLKLDLKSKTKERLERVPLELTNDAAARAVKGGIHFSPSRIFKISLVFQFFLQTHSRINLFQYFNCSVLWIFNRRVFKL